MSDASIAGLAGYARTELSLMDDEECIREVFAHFGLAMYEAQVLEHGIVNALSIIEFIPRRDEFASFDEWSSQFDGYLDAKFEKTFGALANYLIGKCVLSDSLVTQLKEATQSRNHLAHSFFREHAENMLTNSGKQKIIDAADLALRLFHSMDVALHEATAPYRNSFGLTDEWIGSKLSEDIKKVVSGGTVSRWHKNQ